MRHIQTCVLNVLLSQPLSGLQANGPGLHYKVMWRQKYLDSEWTSVTVANNSRFIVSGTPTFVPYELKVQAVNDYGAGPEPAVALGFSGEDRKCERTEINSSVRGAGGGGGRGGEADNAFNRCSLCLNSTGGCSRQRSGHGAE